MNTGHGCCDGVEARPLPQPTTSLDDYEAASPPDVVWGADGGPGCLAAAAAARTPGSSCVLGRKGRGARAGIMQLRPWAAAGFADSTAATTAAEDRDYDGNMEPLTAADRRQPPGDAPAGTSSAGWALADDVAGIFDILMDLDLFLNDQVAPAVRPETDIGGPAWIDVRKEEEEEEEEVKGETEQEKEEGKKPEEKQKEEERVEKLEEKETEDHGEEQGERKERGKEEEERVEKEEKETEDREEREKRGKREEETVEKQEEKETGDPGKRKEKGKEEDQVMEDRGEMELASSPSDAQGAGSALDVGTRLFVTGACLECVHVQVDSALASAARNGHAACLQCILNNLATSGAGAGAGAEPPEAAGLSDRLASRFPLLDAVERGHDEVLRLGLGFLRDRGRLRDALLAADGSGRRPVHLAAHRDHPGCLELLLACTPTEARFWLDGRARRTPLQHAAAGGAVRCLRRLLKVEDAEVTTPSGRTPVSLAAEAGSVGCLEELIDHAEADARRADEDGMTPVHYAAQAGHLNCAHWLVRRARCSLNEARKKDGATAMHLAAGKGRCPILQWALNRELSSAAELDVFGRTPVHYAAEDGQITALRTLSKFSQVSLDATDFLGRTPSNLAERRGHSACVRFLDSCLQQRHPDGEGALLAKLTRSISSPGGLNSKLNRRNSNRRSGRRKHISSVYLEEKTPMPGLERSATLREKPVTEEGAGHIMSALISQVGMMSAAPAVPELSLHRRVINNLFQRFKARTAVEDFTVTL